MAAESNSAEPAAAALSPAALERERVATQALLDAGQLVRLDPSKLHFFKHGAHLRLTIAEDRSFTKVLLARAFPLSDPHHHISVREDENKEIGMLPSLDGLKPDVRKMLEAELERRYLVPKIQRIVKATERFGAVDWEVETSRGPRQFTTRDMREHVTRPAPGRYLISDFEGNRFDADLETLDQRSRDLLMRHL